MQIPFLKVMKKCERAENDISLENGISMTFSLDADKRCCKQEHQTRKFGFVS